MFLLPDWLIEYLSDDETMDLAMSYLYKSLYERPQVKKQQDTFL